MLRRADSLNLPTPTVFPWCTATSAVKEGSPEPSTTRPFVMSRSYAMTLPPLSPDASGPICHLGAYYLCPPCNAPAQMLLWTNQLYARWEVRSIGDMPHGAQAGVLMPMAMASAWFSAASLSGDKVPMKEVSHDLGILMSSSQRMLLACF